MYNNLETPLVQNTRRQKNNKCYNAKEVYERNQRKLKRHQQSEQAKMVE
jgi:hypothetical protein